MGLLSRWPVPQTPPPSASRPSSVTPAAAVVPSRTSTPSPSELPKPTPSRGSWARTRRSTNGSGGTPCPSPRETHTRIVTSSAVSTTSTTETASSSSSTSSQVDDAELHSSVFTTTNTTTHATSMIVVSVLHQPSLLTQTETGSSTPNESHSHGQMERRWGESAASGTGVEVQATTIQLSTSSSPQHSSTMPQWNEDVALPRGRAADTAESSRLVPAARSRSWTPPPRSHTVGRSTAGPRHSLDHRNGTASHSSSSGRITGSSNRVRRVFSSPAASPSSFLSGKSIVAGGVSPQSVCFQRQSSAAVVTPSPLTSAVTTMTTTITTTTMPLFTHPLPPQFHTAHRPILVVPIRNMDPVGSLSIPKETESLSSPNKRNGTCQSDHDNADDDIVHHNHDWATTPPALRPDAWSTPPTGEYLIRGSSYLRDGAKFSPRGGASIMELLTVDVVQQSTVDPTATLLRGVGAHPLERLQQALRNRHHDSNLPAYVVAINLCVPATPNNFHVVSYFGVQDKSVLQDTTTPFGRLAQRFFFEDNEDGDDTFRNATLKLIPRIVEGNFVVRKAVGSKPAILGRKLTQRYIRTENYCEIIIDIGSNAVAQRIVKLALGYAKNLVVDMMFVLEGTTEETLPEQILGGVRLTNLDFKNGDGQRVLAPM